MNNVKVKKKFEWTALFSNYFSTWLIIGILIILTSHIINYDILPLMPNHPQISNLIYLFSCVLVSIGISLVVASIFTYSINSSRFLNFIKDNLSKIVISKEFLKDLSVNTKKEALNLILRPTDKLINIYSNINEYYQEYIDNSLELFETNFKSNLFITCFATHDNKRLKVEFTTSYRIYKVGDTFQPLIIGFENEEYELLETKIIAPDGNRIEITDTEGEAKNEESGFKWTEFKFDINDVRFSSFTHLAIKQFGVEYGKDHWQFFSFKALTPCDGINFELRCDKGLIVKSHMIFDKDKYYSAELSSDKKYLQIITNQWIKPGVGISVIIAKDDNNKENINKENIKTGNINQTISDEV
jgi:hypothetical protein